MLTTGAPAEGLTAGFPEEDLVISPFIKADSVAGTSAAIGAGAAGVAAGTTGTAGSDLQ